jgi:hypothetical protein
VLALQGRAQLLQGRVAEGRKALAEAVETLNRVSQIDPGRAKARVILDQIKVDSDHRDR